MLQLLFLYLYGRIPAPRKKRGDFGVVTSDQADPCLMLTPIRGTAPGARDGTSLGGGITEGIIGHKVSQLMPNSR